MTIWITLGFLAVAGMGLVARQGPVRGRWRVAVSLALLSLTVLLVLGPETTLDSGELDQTRMARTMAALVLAVSATTWGDNERPGHYLVSCFGAALLVTANALPALWIGLLVMISARDRRALLEPRPGFGLLLVATAIACVYAGTGHLHLDALGDWCASQAGPLRIEVYAAIMSLVLGIALTCQLLGSVDQSQAAELATLSDPTSGQVLGTLVLLRIGLLIPALWWEWRWLLGLLALVQAIIALDHWLRLYPEERRHPGWLMTLQGSIALWTLAWSQSPQGLVATIGLVLTLALASIGFGQAARGWVGGVTVMALLLSLGGLPPSLGFRARVLTLQSSGLASEHWAYWPMLASLALPLIAYAWGALVAWTHVSDSSRPRHGPGGAAIGVAAALLALLGGILPEPLIALARWLVK